MNPTIISWVDPTTNTDGSAINPAEITGYEIGARNVNAAGSVAGTYPITANVPAGSNSAPLSVLGPLPAGSYAGAARALGPNDSGWSTEATFTIAPVPASPTGFTVA